jgi:hypothetical protein
MNNNDTNDNIFIGNDFDGTTKAAPAATPTPVRPKPTATAPRRVAVTADQVVTKARNEVLSQWRAAPTADPKAVVDCVDAWGRKVEYHTDLTWETSVKLNTDRRFVAGQRLRMTGGIMASTLTVGVLQPDDGGHLPDYISKKNSPEMVKVYQDSIEKHGRIVAGNTKPSLFGMEVEVHDSPYYTVTLGLLVKYEVKVVSPPAMAGLRLLLSPEQLVDDENRDGYGNVVKPAV